VATLTAQQIYALARGAGFNAGEAVTATAIALAESGGRTDAVGDTTITTAKWGPSVGLWQVRTLKAETGKGSYRDIQWLQASPANQAKAAFEIRKGSNGWKNWSVFSSGAYKSKVDGVEQSVGQAAATGGTAWWQKVLGLPALGAAAAASAATGQTDAGDYVDAGAAVVSNSDGALAQAKKVLETLSSPEFWKRFGIGAAGVVLVLVAVIVMLWSQKSKIVGGVVGDVVKGVKKNG